MNALPTFNLRASIKTCLSCWLYSISLFATDATAYNTIFAHYNAQNSSPISWLSVAGKAIYFILFYFGVGVATNPPRSQCYSPILIQVIPSWPACDACHIKTRSPIKPLWVFDFLIQCFLVIVTNHFCPCDTEEIINRDSFAVPRQSHNIRDALYLNCPISYVSFGSPPQVLRNTDGVGMGCESGWWCSRRRRPH